MPTDTTGFIAYPSSPREVGESILAAVGTLQRNHPSWKLQPWQANDVAGYCLTDPILDNIANARILIADVTKLNFNVTYEIGYAVGLQRRAFLVKNKALVSDQRLLLDVGLFDTMGYSEYSNSDELTKKITAITSFASLPLSDTPLNKRAPVYIVTPRDKAEAEIRIISRVKKAGGIYFRSFDPVENARLSVRSAIENVCSSIGIILPLLSGNRSDSQAHNLRCAFVAGLAHALQKETLLLQAGGSEPVPIDLRDHVTIYDTLDSINAIIADFVPRVTTRLQDEDEFVLSESSTPLADLVLGQSAAENEMAQLGSYYLQTEEFNRVLNGDINVVAGRKGSGKSALFIQVRNKLRRDKRFIILDLHPEGFQLHKFKGQVLRHLEQGTREHTITAFWEYLFFLELAHKLLEKDRNTYFHDHTIRDLYMRTSALFEKDPVASQGDFAERMLKLTERLEESFEKALQDSDDATFLTRSQITEFLYRHDMKVLRETTIEYLAAKKGAWILFDNIDKGWHAHGIDSEDLLILRCLLEALAKLRRDLGRAEISCKTVVFLRNDVFELLIQDMPDRGKISRLVVDWTDQNLLREVLRRRFVSNLKEKAAEFDTIWRNIAQTHIRGGLESSNYVIERCLMRPRALIDLLMHSKAHAVNLRHTKILEEDFAAGEQAYSTDLINQIDLEIQDAFPHAQHSLYAFIEAPHLLDHSQLSEYLNRVGLETEKHGELLELLLWYGFLGILRDDGCTTYIYDVNYEMRKLIALRNKRAPGDLVYCVNPAFWAGLDIKA